ncbi:MAG: NADH-quinone oxidoreductase subunit H [Candidatus Cloacimonas sp.]|jgi:formate hydrogenlyase subunit 4|nr:NADH-quinone oxidoreductase subunit H [Candidatus Cloacimonas sp.]
MIISLIFILILPLLFVGLIAKTKAVWAGRKGASILQPFYTFAKLPQKHEIHSKSSGLIFKIAPVMALAATFSAALFVPFGAGAAILSFRGDFFLFMSLLALGKAVMVLAAMDVGSSFEGMGASREISFTAFLEPAFLLIIGSLTYAGGFASIGQLFARHTVNIYNEWSVIIAVLTALALFIMMLVEGSRVPFDDPATHLELTMIHEVMVLDTSGINLALVHYTAALKVQIYASLISYFLIPEGMGSTIITLVYLLSCLALAVLTGLAESLMPRYRISRNLELVIIPLSIALLVLAALIVHNLGGI